MSWRTYNHENDGSCDVIHLQRKQWFVAFVMSIE